MDSGPIVLFKHVPDTLARPELRAFAKELSRQLAGGQHFSCLLTDDAELQRLNRQFRGKDKTTDVLSFRNPHGESLGDVAISLQRAAEQAAEFGHSLETEICVLMLHGLLHLLGHDHETDKGQMRRLEIRWRRLFKLPNGLLERVSAQC